MSNSDEDQIPFEEKFKNPEQHIEGFSSESGGKISPVQPATETTSKKSKNERIIFIQTWAAIMTVFVGIVCSSGLVLFGAQLRVGNEEVTTSSSEKVISDKDGDIKQIQKTTTTTTKVNSSNKTEINLFIVSFALVLLTLCISSVVSILNPKIVLAVLEKVPDVNKFNPFNKD